jgi:hypothetical protein
MNEMIRAVSGKCGLTNANWKLSCVFPRGSQTLARVSARPLNWGNVQSWLLGESRDLSHSEKSDNL